MALLSLSKAKRRGIKDGAAGEEGRDASDGGKLLGCRGREGRGQGGAGVWKNQCLLNKEAAKSQGRRIKTYQCLE